MQSSNRIYDAAFDQIRNYCENYGNNFLLAVSGGGDSLALSAIFSEYKKKYGDIKLSAAIIDHAIAPNSSEVANSAYKQLEKIDIDAKIVRVSEKIVPPLQENARNARFDNLTNYSKSINANAIVLGHNRDDLVETIIFRMLRNTGIIGLSAIEPITCSVEFDQPAIFFRPLLSQSRKELREYLNILNIDYYDDPAIENRNFSRVNIRKQLEHLQINSDKIINIANAAKNLREKYNQMPFDTLKKIEIIDNQIYLNLDSLKWLGNEIGCYTISKLIQSIRNLSHPPKESMIKNLWQGILTNKYYRANLSQLDFKSSKWHN